MALKKTIEWTGFNVESAYKCIKDFVAVKEGEDFRVNVHSNVYKDSTKEVCLYGENYNVTVPYNDGDVSLAALYTEIKKEALNEGWIDC